MQLTFLGAAGEVTGSCYLVDTGEIRLLVDCGMFQGGGDADRRTPRPAVRGGTATQRRSTRSGRRSRASAGCGPSNSMSRCVCTRP
jgi:hypothetical protein